MTQVYHTDTKIAISVNQTRINKEWVTHPKKDYHNSFVNRVLTIDELTSLIVAGYSFCDRLKGDYVRRNQDNFEALRIICIDDDNPEKLPNRFDFWRSDDFIANNAGFMHYTSSSSSEHEKVRIVFVMDCDVTDIELAKEILNALHFKYPNTDKSHVTQVWSGAKNKLMFGFGNGLFFDVVEKSLLRPYREHKAQNTILNYKVADEQKKAIVPKDYDDFVIRKLAETFGRVKGASEGNRHTEIYKAGLVVGAMMAANWTSKELFNDRESRLSSAASSHDQDHRNDRAIRTFRDGIEKSNPMRRPNLKPKVKSVKPKNFNGLEPIIYPGAKGKYLDIVIGREEFLSCTEWANILGLGLRATKKHLKAMETDGLISKQLKDERKPSSRSNPYVYGYSN